MDSYIIPFTLGFIRCLNDVLDYSEGNHLAIKIIKRSPVELMHIIQAFDYVDASFNERKEIIELYETYRGE